MIADILFCIGVGILTYQVTGALARWFIYGTPRRNAADEYWLRAHKPPQPHEPGERPRDPALLGTDKPGEGGAGGHHG